MLLRCSPIACALLLPACMARTELFADDGAAGDSTTGDAMASGDRTAGDPSSGDPSPSDPGPGDAAAPGLEAVDCAGPMTIGACADLELLLHLDSNAPTDASGNNLIPTCTSCPTFDASAGRFGGAFVFDGNDYFEIADDPALDISGAVTMSAWFRPSALAAGDFTVVVAKILGAPLLSNYWLGHQAEQFVVTFIDDAGSGWHNHGDGMTWPLGTWYHLVGVIDNVDNRVRLYVNGTLVFDDSETATMGQEDGSLYIGWGPGDQGAAGVIDEVAIWRRALTEAEIQALYPP